MDAKGNFNAPPDRSNLTDIDGTHFETSPGLIVEPFIPAKEPSENDATLHESSADRGLVGPLEPSTENLVITPTGKYNLLREIARGGMGVVMEAEDLKLTRNVAMKVMMEPGASSPTRRQRFIEEARITSRLQHPGIMPIYELGADKSGNTFYTMKYVTGKTLKTVLKELKEGNKQTATDYPLINLLTTLQRVCDAIAYAHDNGVIHRDLKPENIMLGAYGEVLVLDWGLAKVLPRSSNLTKISPIPAPEITPAALLSESPEPTDNKAPPIGMVATMEGKALGTPGYMAPEQARGEVSLMDEKSDIYSLGAILFHILTLESTIGSERTTSRLDLLEQIGAGKITHPTPCKNAPKVLLAVARKALSLHPEDRYPTVIKFQADLKAYMDGFATSTEEQSVMKRFMLLVKRHKIGSVFTLLLFIVIVIALAVNHSERMKTEQADKLAAAEGKRATEALLHLKATAPGLIALADYHLEREEFPKALDVASDATALVPESPVSHHKRGDILQTLTRFAEAAVEYNKALQLDPLNLRAALNLELCYQMTPQVDVQQLSAALWAQERFHEASYVILSTVKDQKPEMIKLVLEWLLDKWKIQYKALNVTADSCELDLSNCPISNLMFIRKMPLTKLDLSGCQNIFDIRPLAPTRLKSLILSNCTNIIDFSPLKKLPLTSLQINGNASLKDLSFTTPIRLTELDIRGCAEITDLTPLRGSRLTKLVLDGCTKITDLTPLKGVPLKELSLKGCTGLTDLSPLANMPLLMLDISGCTNIADLGILKKLPQNTIIRDSDRPTLSRRAVPYP